MYETRPHRAGARVVIGALSMTLGLTAFGSLAAAQVQPTAGGQQTPPAAAPAQAGQQPPGGGGGAGALPLVPLRYPSALPTGRVTYRTLSETNAEMEHLAETYPTKVVRFEMPRRTLLGQHMYGLEISHDVKISSGKPVFLMTGLHHAREWPTVELTMEFVNDVLMNDGKDSLITSLLDRVRLIVVPIVNPDGYDMSRTLLSEQKRKSCRVEMGKVPTFAQCADPAASGAGVDLNRNYGAFWGGGGSSPGLRGTNSRGEAPFSEPEIQNMRDLMWSNQVTVALSNHTPDAKVLRAPSAAEEPVPADVVPYDSLAQLLGADLKWDAGPWPDVYYVATGTMEETAYYSSGTFAFTFENTPGGRGFHPAYNYVVDQYFGTGAYLGSNARAGFLRLLAAAAKPELHSILQIRAPAGATLTLQKSFTMETSPITGTGTGADTLTSPALTFPVQLTSTMVVPKGAKEVTWHVNPSPRPSQHAQAFLPEVWKLTCTQSNGRNKQTVDVSVARGKTATVDLSRCR